MRKIGFHTLLVFALSAALFVAFTADCLPIDGDSAAYIQQIEDGNLGERTTHWGFVACGIVFTRMTPLSVGLSMNVFASALGAIGIAATFLIGCKLAQDVRAGYLSAALLFSSGTFFGNSVFTNVYQAQAVFILLALLFWLYQKSDVLAALFFLLAQLMNPISVAVVPLFFIRAFPPQNPLSGAPPKDGRQDASLTSRGWPHLWKIPCSYVLKEVMDVPYKRIARLALASAPLYAIFLYVSWDDFWYSSRGVLGVTRYGIYHHFPFFWRLKDTLYHVSYDFHAMGIFFIFGGLWLLFSRNYARIKFLGIIGIVFLALVFCIPDNQFPKMQAWLPWLSLVGGVLITGRGNAAVSWRKPAYSILLVIFSICFILSLSRNMGDAYNKKTSNARYKALCKNVNSLIGEDVYVVGDWGRCMLYRHYNAGTIPAERVLDPTNPGFEAAIQGKHICVLDAPTRDFIRDKFKSRFQEVRLDSGIVWFNQDSR